MLLVGDLVLAGLALLVVGVAVMAIYVFGEGIKEDERLRRQVTRTF